MTTHLSARRLVVFLLLGGAIVLGHCSASAQDSLASAPTTLTLADCLQLALQRQPRIAAQRASLAAAEDGCRALENLRLAAVIEPEIPIRRRQAALGVSAAAAGVDQAERETIYGVTRTYFTVLFAREQERVARGVVDRLTATHDAAKGQLEAGGNVTSTDVQRTLTYLRLAETKRIQAEQGVKRALAALREAVGLGPEGLLEVPAGTLVEPQARPVKEEVVALALGRRGELIRASLFADIVCLEVEAQGTTPHRKMETFAAGGDIHASIVPPGVSNNEYRPAAVPPEMPDLLVGTRHDRVRRAQSLHARARAVVETTRNLIALEAEDAFLRWEEASLEVPKAREAAQTGDEMAASQSKDFTAGLRVKVEDVVNARVLAAQARAQYNEFLYRQLLALADLERVTGGGFCAGLVEPAPLRLQLAPGDGAGTR